MTYEIQDTIKSLSVNILSRRSWNQIWQLSIPGWIYLIVIWFLYRRVRFFNGVFAVQRSSLHQHLFANELPTR